MSETVQKENLDKESMLRQLNKEDAEIKSELAQIVIPKVVIPHFEFKLKVNELEEIASSLSTLVDECTFYVDNEGLRARTMDPSHVALIDVNVHNSGFDAFEVELGKEPEIKFAVRIDDVLRVIKILDKKDYVTVSYGEDSKLYLRQNEQKANFRTIEVASGSTPLPKLNFNTSFSMGTDAMKNISKIQVMSEYISLRSTEKELVMFGASDNGELEQVYTVNNYNSFNLESLIVKDESKATYSLDYILKMLKVPVASKKEIEFEYSSKMPMRITHRIGNAGKIQYYLAPRVQD